MGNAHWIISGSQTGPSEFFDYVIKSEILMSFADERGFQRRYLAWLRALDLRTYPDTDGQGKHAVEGGETVAEGTFAPIWLHWWNVLNDLFDYRTTTSGVARNSSHCWRETVRMTSVRWSGSSENPNGASASLAPVLAVSLSTGIDFSPRAIRCWL